MAPRTPSHQKVVGLNVSVDVALGVHNLEATQKLVGKHEDRLEIEAPTAVIKQVFQALAQQVNHHDIVVPFDAVPAHAGNAHWLGREGGRVREEREERRGKDDTF